MEGPRRSSLRVSTRAVSRRGDATAPKQRRKQGKQRREQGKADSNQPKPWDAKRSRLKGILSKIRLHQHFLDSYAHDGFKGANREKLKPQAELERARRRIAEAKAEARALLRGVAESNPGGARWDDVPEDADGQLDLDEVACTACGSCTSGEDNDILLCDFEGCFRAFHQRCLAPPLPAEAMPDEEEDWFCPQCECLTDGLALIEEEFGRRRGKELISWKDVFPETSGDFAAGASSSGSGADDERGGSGSGSGSGAMERSVAGESGLPADSEEEEEDEEFVLGDQESEGDGETLRNSLSNGGGGADHDGEDHDGSSSDAAGSSDSDETVSNLGSVDDAELQQLSDAGSVAFESESDEGGHDGQGGRRGSGDGSGGGSGSGGSDSGGAEVGRSRRRRSRRQARLTSNGQQEQLPKESECVGQRVLVAHGAAGLLLAGMVVSSGAASLASSAGLAAAAKAAAAAAVVGGAAAATAATVAAENIATAAVASASRSPVPSSPRRLNAPAIRSAEPLESPELPRSPKRSPGAARRAPAAEGSCMSGHDHGGISEALVAELKPNTTPESGVAATAAAVVQSAAAAAESAELAAAAAPAAALWECRFEDGSVRLLSVEEVRNGINLFRLRQAELKKAGAGQRLRPPAAAATAAAAAAVAESGALDVANIVTGRRRRSAVNYVKLNEQMFGGGGYSAELDADEEGGGGGSGLGRSLEDGEAEMAKRPKKRRRSEQVTAAAKRGASDG